MSDIELPKDLESILNAPDPIPATPDTPAPTPAAVPDPPMVPLIDLIDLAEHGDTINPLYFSGGDPNFTYAWLNTNAQMLEHNKLVFGYEIVKAGDSVKTLVPPNVLGERRVADVVLARMARARYDRLTEYHIKKTKDAMNGPNEKWLSDMRAAGVPTENVTRIAKKEGM